MMVSLDDQVKAYVKKIMSQLNKWVQKSKISKLVIVVTSKETGEHLERWQFDVCTQLFLRSYKILTATGQRLQRRQQVQKEGICARTRECHTGRRRRCSNPRRRENRSRDPNRNPSAVPPNHSLSHIPANA